MNKARHLMQAFFVAAIPTIASIIMIFACFHTTPNTYHPFWNDELDYWHQILTFVHHGFSGGYYSIEELTAQASFSHFGTHGPFFPLLYGTIGKVAGWTPISGPLFNAGIFAAATMLFLKMIKAERDQFLLIGFVLLTFWPIILYLPTTMQEPLQMSLALIMAGLFYRLLNAPTATWTYIITFSVIAVAALLRQSWGILFIPLLLIRQTGPAAKAKSLAGGLACLSIALLTFSFFSAPYPDNFVNNLLALIKTRPSDAWIFFYDHFSANFHNYFSWGRNEFLETGLRYQLLIALLGALGTGVLARQNQQDRQEAMIHCCNILLIVLLVIFLYEINEWRAYRVLSPHLLFSLALFIACRRNTVTYVLIAAALIFAQNFMTLYPQFHKDHFSGNSAARADFSATYGKELSFDYEAAPWGNSLLIDILDYKPFITGLPAGIGINCVLDWKRISYPLKSAYVIIPPEVFHHIRDKAHLQLLTPGKYGALFRNLDAPRPKTTEGNHQRSPLIRP